MSAISPCSPLQTIPCPHFLRGQQQGTLCAELQGITCSRFVGKLHNASPSGTASVICHDNGPFHSSKLRKCLKTVDGLRRNEKCRQMQDLLSVELLRSDQIVKLFSGSPVPAAHLLPQATGFAPWEHNHAWQSGFWWVDFSKWYRPAPLWQSLPASVFPGQQGET